MKLPYKILIIEDDEQALEGLVELLREAEHAVTGATAYDVAKQLLAEESYDLLISDVRLRGYNGLNLVRQTYHDHPEMAMMIITGYDEPMMELEAGRYGAEFVRKPIRPVEFCEAVARSLSKVRRERRWPRKQVTGGFRVTVGGQPAAVMDVCYGGLRLQIPEGSGLPSMFDVEVSGIGLQLEVEPVWWHLSAPSGTMLCGAALTSHSTPAARTWREIVDRLTA